MLRYKEFESLSNNLRNDLLKEYPQNKVSLGDNGITIGFWIDTKPRSTFVPLETSDGLFVRIDYTTLKPSKH